MNNKYDIMIMKNKYNTSDEAKEKALLGVNKILQRSVETIIENIKVSSGTRLTPIQEDEELNDIADIIYEFVSEKRCYCCPSCLW